MTYHFCLQRLSTPIGVMLVVSDADNKLRAVDWHDYEPRMHRLLTIHYGDSVRLSPSRSSTTASNAIEEYFAGRIEATDRIAVCTEGTPFQCQVWKALRTIRAGTTLSYGELARRIRRPAAVRAVGLANGANPVGVVVPCHRVVGANGRLTGYGGGIERKRWLLQHEGVEERLSYATHVRSILLSSGLLK